MLVLQVMILDWNMHLFPEHKILALLDDPHYVKALQRRAASNEQLNTWSSLSSAREGASLYYDVNQYLRTHEHRL